MRVVYSCMSSLSLYILSSSVRLSAVGGVLTYLLYIPIPFNVDNFVATYVMLKLLSISELIGKVKVKLGLVSELAQRRAAVDSITPKVVSGVETEVKDMGNYTLHIFTPKVKKSTGAVIFYHGGGFTVLHVSNYQRFLSWMAVTLGCVVFSPEYRLAPEHPWPTGDQDCAHATQFVFENAAAFGVDRHKIALTGDSAGGFLTFVTWYRMRDYFKKNQVVPALLSMIYPALGYRFDTPSYQRNGSMPFLTVDDVLFYYVAHGGWTPSEAKTALLRDNMHVDDSALSANFKRNLDPEKWLDRDELRDWTRPQTVDAKRVFTQEEQDFRARIQEVVEEVTFVPLNIPDAELMDIPPVATYVCEHDVLKNDGQMMHSRLSLLGKKSKLVVLEGAFHAQMFFARQFLGLKKFARTTAAFDEYVEFIGSHIE